MPANRMWRNQDNSKLSLQITRARDTKQVSKLPLTPQHNVKTIIKYSSRFVAILICFLAGLFLTKQAGCHMVAPADVAANRGYSPVEYHWNCGLNVGYVTLRLFHKDVNIYKLADEIKAGERLERNVSLLDLKKAFEKYGLTAKGFKADYPEEIIEFAQPENILIIRLDFYLVDQNIGHFIAIKGGRDHVIVIDPPYHPKKFARQDIIEYGILSHATGEFLLVY